ncbi:peptidoglycan DD-metalloendopeptidase family protein [Thalassobaculum sp. OXR-137]|uniref:murein hydrolase activator EnvC family protein n=1 Tax=Thalassobaculum sp. OXR-137 TaxID=3100173 RepID=UPI002AC93B49|nr:peptidoglycan DD-metalloendopeptidase family protein [Thalassobaculum sp. OXR-137]WPZ35038.1 peptidoglycan DD-metalloendopeptidase family protein [Thalassobaculum sp. OXR-137]
MAPVLILAAACLAAGLGAWVPAARAQTATTATAEDPTAELRRIEKALEGERKAGSKLDRLASALAGEIERLRAGMAAAATRAQRTERDMMDAEQTLDTLRQEVKEKRGRLLERHQELSQLTGALQRLARHPPETLLLVGRAPLDTVHTGILLESAIPRLNGDATELRRDLDTLATLEADIRAQRDRLALAAQDLDAERAQLAALAAEKGELLAGTRNRASGAAAEIRALSESARSLRELIDSLEKREAAEAEEQRKLAALVTPKLRPQRPASPAQDGGEPPPAPVADDGAPVEPPVQAAALPPALPPGPSLKSARGHLFAPVTGTVVQRYGKSRPGELTKEGILLRTRPGSLVIAPHDGIVLYAGPFEGFGRILIIEHGDGYHTLLAGLARVDLSVGTRVLAGEPVGAMAASGNAAPEIYLELRHNGDPIDPLPWFAGLTEKAKG